MTTKRFRSALLLVFAALCFIGASSKPKPGEFSVKRITGGAVSVKLTIKDAAMLATGKGTIERSTGGAFTSILTFEKAKKTLTFKDTEAGTGNLKYRAKVQYSGAGRRRSFSSTVSLKASGNGGSSSSSSRPAATPTPGELFRPTPLPTANSNAYFDSSGNVTAAGKAAFGIPTNLSANKNTGAGNWSDTCRPCHGTSEKSGRSFNTIKYSVARPPVNLTLSDQYIADLAAYLNRYR